MGIRILAMAGLLLAGFGCSTTTTVRSESEQQPAAAKSRTQPAGAPQEASARKLQALERQLAIAVRKLEKARRDLSDQQVAGKEAVDKARAALDLSKARLGTFETRDTPARVAKARLSLKQGEDSVANAKEELQQLEYMYKDHEIADKTKEIVIRRAKRRLGRSEERLALQRNDLETLRTHTLVTERKKLQLDVLDKQRGVAAAQRSMESGVQGKQIAVMSAEAEIERVKSEIDGLKEKLP